MMTTVTAVPQSLVTKLQRNTGKQKYQYITGCCQGEVIKA